MNNYQSLSVVVPNKKCINNCAFCVSKMHTEDYKNQMDGNLPFYDLYLNDYMKRLEYARDNGVNTVMLTGNSEPQQNRRFLMDFGMMMQLMERPFRNIEMQTTGWGLDRNYLRFLRNHVGVNTISLSVSSFFDDLNAEIIRFPDTGKGQFSLKNLCFLIKEYDFNLRLSLNLNKALVAPSEDFSEHIINVCKDHAADQVTFRYLYASGDNEQARWINENGMEPWQIQDIKRYIQNYPMLGVLPYGSIIYDVQGMSVVFDDDCMSKIVKEEQKYLILREDCKLYSKWDTKASLVF
nr:radical SAM protein [uncultured Sphaerochaeta sp.]